MFLAPVSDPQMTKLSLQLDDGATVRDVVTANNLQVYNGPHWYAFYSISQSIIHTRYFSKRY